MTEFTPDWDELVDAAGDAWLNDEEIDLRAATRSAIAEYTRQLAAAGLLVVRSDHLEAIYDIAIEHYHFWRKGDIAAQEHIRSVLAADQERNNNDHP
jgi:hypothetical protein